MEVSECPELSGPDGIDRGCPIGSSSIGSLEGPGTFEASIVDVVAIDATVDGLDRLSSSNSGSTCVVPPKKNSKIVTDFFRNFDPVGGRLCLLDLPLFFFISVSKVLNFHKQRKSIITDEKMVVNKNPRTNIPDHVKPVSETGFSCPRQA